jgi:DNA-binding NtrC family response regulator
MAGILVVDDQKVQRKNLAFYLKSQGYDVDGAESGEEALSKLQSGCFDIVITDYKLDKMSGHELMLRAREIQPSVEFIVMSAFGNIPLAVDLMKDGAADFISRPFEFAAMLNAIEKVLSRHQATSKEQKQRRFQIVAQSQKMKDVVDLAMRAAASDVAILIEGEAGTGKELFARTVHFLSRRQGGEFLVAECAGGSEEDLDQALFGQAGAPESGLVGKADGGTLFLRDVHHLSPKLQARLLRFMREGFYSPANSADIKKSDIRIMAASTKSLKSMVSEETFRDDLYYMLAIMVVFMPPLRARAEDIIPLVKHFLMKHRSITGKNIKGVAPEVITWMTSYDWPGNVRELENIIARACALATGDTLDESLVFTLPQDRPEVEEGTAHLALTLKDNQRSLILKALRQNNGNYSRTASQLGISRTTLWRRLKRFKIEGLPVEQERTA